MLLRKKVIAGLIACSFAVGSLSSLTGCTLDAAGKIGITPEAGKTVQGLLDSFGISLTKQEGDQGTQSSVKKDDIEKVYIDDKEVPLDDMEITDGQIKFKKMMEGNHIIKIKYKNVKEYVKLPINAKKDKKNAKLINQFNQNELVMAEGGMMDDSGNFQENYMIDPAANEEDYDILKRDGTKLNRITFDANFKVTIGEEFQYADPGLGLVNRKKVPLIIFVMPEKLKEKELKLLRIWLDDMELPPFAIKRTELGNLGIAAPFIKKYRDEKQRLPKTLRVAVARGDVKLIYTIEFKSELPKLKDDGIDIVFNDFVIYIKAMGKDVDINKPQFVAPKRLGWIFLPKPKDKNIGKVRQVWVDGLPVPPQDIKFARNPKTGVPGIFIDLKAFTMNPCFQIHKVVLATEVIQPQIYPLPAGTAGATGTYPTTTLKVAEYMPPSGGTTTQPPPPTGSYMPPTGTTTGGYIPPQMTAYMPQPPQLIRLAFKVKVKFPKHVIPLIKEKCIANIQPVMMKDNSTFDQQEATTVVSENSVSDQDVVVVDENTMTTTLEVATEAVIVSETTADATNAAGAPPMDELVTSTGTVAETDITASDTEVIDMSSVTMAEQGTAISNEPVYTGGGGTPAPIPM